MQINLKRLLALVLACLVLLGSTGMVSAAEPVDPGGSDNEQAPDVLPEESVPPDSTEDITPSTGTPDEPTTLPVTESAPTEESSAPSIPNTDPAPTEPNSSVDAPGADSQDVPDGPALLSNRSFTNLGMYQILSKGKVYLDPYDTGKYLSSINRMYFTNPTEFAFCIQPGTPTGGSYTQNSNVNPWTRLSENQRRAMGVVLALGFPKTYHHDGFPEKPGRAQVMGDFLSQWQRSEYYAATQIIIWEILRGERSATPPYTRTSSATFDKFYGFNSPDWYGLLAEYTALDKLLANYGVVPSFAASSQSGAPSHEMIFDESSGTYKLTLKDSRNVLTLLTPASRNPQEMRHFEFQAGGITIRRSGNTLTITAPESMGDQLAAGVLVKSNSSTADPSSNCIVWSSGSKQVLISSAGGSAEFPPAYFKLTAQPKIKTGSLRIQKATNIGSVLAGWKFAVSTDPDGNHPIPGSPFTTPADGVVVINDLLPGTYYVKEVDESDLYPYWKFDTSCQEIVVVADKTSTATVTNIRLGRIAVKKIAVNGTAEGWNFEILKNGSVIETITTGSDGYAYSSYLEPGPYLVREIHDRDGTYWEYDVNVEQDVTVKPQEDTPVTYTNEQFGLLEIVKVMENEGPLDGWQFRITDAAGQEIEGSPFVTDAAGKILTGKLKPGTYTVEELIPEDSIYHCVGENPQTVTVTEGQTASVIFANALRPGKIEIEKVDPSGKTLAGAAFLLEWSEDGVTWAPVGSSNTIIKGGCSTPGLSHGCLATGTDGKISFEGLHPALQYRITEVIAPDGYNLLTDYAYIGPLPVDNLTVQLRAVNTPVMVLPHTGSASLALVPMLMTMGLTMSAAVLFYLRRKEK